MFRLVISVLVVCSRLLSDCLLHVQVSDQCACTVAPRYNAVVGVHDIGPRCKRGALRVPVSATRGTTNNN